MTGDRRRSVLLLGATSGIMAALAAELAADGNDLLLVARDDTALSALAADLTVRFDVGVRTYLLDALAWSEHGQVIDACLTDGGTDLRGAVMAIGYLGSQDQAIEDPAEMRRILDTNFIAPALLLGRLANHFEAAGGGFLCALSSVAGERGRQSNYVYGSAKAGLTAYLEGLRNRLHPAGVRVLTVKPGFVDTAMTYGLDAPLPMAAPGRVARGIRRAIRKGKDEVYVPGYWRWIMLALRAVPEWLFKRMRL